jgi:DNA-binding protein HU-beta
MNTEEIVKTIALTADISTTKARAIVDAAAAALAATLKQGEPLELDDFASWWPVVIPAHPGVNPRTRQPLIVPAQIAVSFRPSQALRDALN